jgi:hypothetical protein
LDTIVGRSPQQALEALITYSGGGDSRRLDNLRTEDVFKSGENAVVFRIVEKYASGRAVLPIIAYKKAGNWKLTLLQNFDREATAAFQRSAKAKGFKISEVARESMAEPRNPEWPNFAYIRDWNIELNGITYKAAALGNSSDYKYFNHPEFGDEQMLIVTSFKDDDTNARHRYFYKVMKLDSSTDTAEWKSDETWNGGIGIVSNEPRHFDELNFDQLYFSGIKTINHVDFWGVSYGKERSAK